MAEVKNAFISSKMNKDLEARLVPSGEYRNAINAQISKSEGADAGALENVLGNTLKVNFSATSGCGCILHVVGVLADEFTNFIYVFLTDNTGSVYNKEANNYIYRYNTVSETAVKLAEGSFLNFSTRNQIYGINILEDFLFFTDNRNQPRKINVGIAASNSAFYNSEDKISVAKLNPYQPIELYEEITASIAAGFKAPSTNQGVGEYQTTMFNVSDEFLPISTNPTNPYYEANYAGDKEFLKDKFIRFSYRFKFKDGEYSVLAPFTQIAFVPKQDGYFIYDDSNAGDIQDDMKDGFKTTIIKFMENKVDKIGAIIPMPLKSDGSSAQANQIATIFDIDEIEIIGKESSGLALQLIDTITADQIATEGTNTVIKYVYESTKPFKTLPSSEITRVYDKVPVKALAQEVSSNRIIYGNYQDKHTSPEGIDYNVTATNKSSFATYTGDDVVKNTTSIVEYPNHTLKQNRNYQVGFVLSDRYGRSSSVILSNTDQTVTIGGVTYGGSTLYHPYSSYSATTGADNFPGDSLKIILNNSIGPSAPNESTNWPGIYNGDATSSDYNPLGWYSYRIVVKQTQQDYYNVYLPGIMASQPIVAGIDPIDNENIISNTVLIGDNINKIPRDLSEVGPQQKQFRSSVRLFPRVINTNTVPTNNKANTQYGVGLGNEQIVPEVKGITVNTISNLRDLFDFDPVNPPIPNNFPQFYLYDSDPLIAQLGVNSKLGQMADFTTPSGNESYTNITMTLGHPFYPLSSSCTSGTWENTVNNYFAFSSTDVFVTDVQGVSLNTAYTSVNPYVANWAGGPTNVVLNGWDFSCTGTGGSNNPPETPKKQYILLSDDADIPVGKSVVLTGKNSALPGIQQLAVVETEPTESVIDIYYETTSAGLITQINNVSDSDTGAASSLKDDYNSVNFNEGLDAGDYIFDYKAKNAAGQIIQTSNTTPSGTNVVSFSLISVFTNESTPVDVTSYFSNFTGNQNTGWKIQLQSGWDANVWYGSDAGKRSFTFNFTVTVTPNLQPSVSTTFSTTRDLVNVAPVIENVSPSSPVELPYGNTFITDIKANNGASQNNSNRGKNITWSIVSATGADGVTYNNKFEIIGNSVNTSDLYNIGRLQRSTGGNGTTDNTFIVQDYTIVARASDPNDSTDQTIQVTMGNTPTYVKSYNGNTVSGSIIEEAIDWVIIKIEDGSSSQNGYYLYNGTWDNLNNSNPVQIYNTTACTGSCGSYSGEWFFASSNSAVIDLFEEAIGETITTININTESTSGYQFIIV